jgi:hypothetical protein
MQESPQAQPALQVTQQPPPVPLPHPAKDITKATTTT